MDNAYEAIIMAGSALLFVIGLSVAVYNYSRVMEVNDKILTNSEYYDRTAENFQYADYYNVNDGLNEQNTLSKIYSGADIARMILNMYEVKDTEVEVEEGSYDAITGVSTVRTFKTKDIGWDSITVDEETYKASNYSLDNSAGSQFNKFKELIKNDAEYIIRSTNYTLDPSKGIITSRKVVFEKYYRL